jgi:hypothetical protein
MIKLSFLEISEIKKFIDSKKDMTFDEKKEVINFIESRQKSFSFEEKKELVKFIEKSTNTSDDTSTKEVPIDDIITEVMNKIKLDESFILSINENHIEFISETVAEKLKSDFNFTKQLIGPPGKDGEVGQPGRIGKDGKTGTKAKINVDEIINKLKTDVDFIHSIRQGQQYWYAGGSGGPSQQEIIELIQQYGGSVTGPYISTINSTSGDILLSAGNNVGITQVGNTFIFSASTTSVSAGVATVNSLIGDIILSATGTNSIVQFGNTIVVSGVGGTGTVSGSYVRTVDGLSGDVGISAGTNVGITKIGNTLYISASGGGSTSAGVETINSIDGAVILSAGPNINITNVGQTITISAANTGSGTGNSYFPGGW